MNFDVLIFKTPIHQIHKTEQPHIYVHLTTQDARQAATDAYQKHLKTNVADGDNKLGDRKSKFSLDGHHRAGGTKFKYLYDCPFIDPHDTTTPPPTGKYNIIYTNTHHCVQNRIRVRNNELRLLSYKEEAHDYPIGAWVRFTGSACRSPKPKILGALLEAVLGSEPDSAELGPLRRSGSSWFPCSPLRGREFYQRYVDPSNVIGKVIEVEKLGAREFLDIDMARAEKYGAVSTMNSANCAGGYFETIGHVTTGFSYIIPGSRVLPMIREKCGPNEECSGGDDNGVNAGGPGGTIVGGGGGGGSIGGGAANIIPPLGNIASSTACAKQCTENPACRSYEWSEEMKICQLNQLKYPNSKGVLDTVFCIKTVSSGDPCVSWYKVEGWFPAQKCFSMNSDEIETKCKDWTRERHWFSSYNLIPALRKKDFEEEPDYLYDWIWKPITADEPIPVVGSTGPKQRLEYIDFKASACRKFDPLTHKKASNTGTNAIQIETETMTTAGSGCLECIKGPRELNKYRMYFLPGGTKEPVKIGRIYDPGIGNITVNRDVFACGIIPPEGDDDVHDVDDDDTLTEEERIQKLEFLEDRYCVRGYDIDGKPLSSPRRCYWHLKCKNQQAADKFLGAEGRCNRPSRSKLGLLYCNEDLDIFLMMEEELPKKIKSLEKHPDTVLVPRSYGTAKSSSSSSSSSSSTTRRRRRRRRSSSRRRRSTTSSSSTVDGDYTSGRRRSSESGRRRRRGTHDTAIYTAANGVLKSLPFTRHHAEFAALFNIEFSDKSMPVGSLERLEYKPRAAKEIHYSTGATIYDDYSVPGGQIFTSCGRDLSSGDKSCGLDWRLRLLTSRHPIVMIRRFWIGKFTQIQKSTWWAKEKCTRAAQDLIADRHDSIEIDTNLVRYGDIATKEKRYRVQEYQKKLLMQLVKEIDCARRTALLRMSDYNKRDLIYEKVKFTSMRGWINHWWHGRCCPGEFEAIVVGVKHQYNLMIMMEHSKYMPAHPIWGHKEVDILTAREWIVEDRKDGKLLGTNNMVLEVRPVVRVATDKINWARWTRSSMLKYCMEEHRVATGAGKNSMKDAMKYLRRHALTNRLDLVHRGGARHRDCGNIEQDKVFPWFHSNIFSREVVSVMRRTASSFGELGSYIGDSSSSMLELGRKLLVQKQQTKQADAAGLKSYYWPDVYNGNADSEVKVTHFGLIFCRAQGSEKCVKLGLQLQEHYWLWRKSGFLFLWVDMVPASSSTDEETRDRPTLPYIGGTVLGDSTKKQDTIDNLQKQLRDAFEGNTKDGRGKGYSFSNTEFLKLTSDQSTSDEKVVYPLFINDAAVKEYLYTEYVTSGTAMDDVKDGGGIPSLVFFELEQLTNADIDFNKQPGLKWMCSDGLPTYNGWIEKEITECRKERAAGGRCEQNPALKTGGFDKFWSAVKACHETEKPNRQANNSTSLNDLKDPDHPEQTATETKWKLEGEGVNGKQHDFIGDPWERVIRKTCLHDCNDESTSMANVLRGEGKNSVKNACVRMLLSEDPKKIAETITGKDQETADGGSAAGSLTAKWTAVQEELNKMVPSEALDNNVST